MAPTFSGRASIHALFVQWKGADPLRYPRISWPRKRCTKNPSPERRDPKSKGLGALQVMDGLAQSGDTIREMAQPEIAGMAEPQKGGFSSGNQTLRRTGQSDHTPMSTTPTTPPT